MKSKKFLFGTAFAALALLSVSCDPEQESPRKPDVDEREISIDAESSYSFDCLEQSLTINVKSNTYWGVDCSAWVEEIPEATEENPEPAPVQVLQPISWVSSNILYGKGDGQITFKVNPNNKSNDAREAIIKVWTADENVYKEFTIIQDGDPNYVPVTHPDPITLRFGTLKEDLESYGWVTAGVATPLTNNLKGSDDKEYPFTYVNSALTTRNMLVLVNGTSYVQLPAMECFKISSVTIKRGEFGNAAAKIQILDAKGNPVTGGDATLLADPAWKEPYTWTLAGTKTGEGVRIAMAESGAGIEWIEIVYEWGEDVAENVTLEFKTYTANLQPYGWVTASVKSENTNLLKAENGKEYSFTYYDSFSNETNRMMLVVTRGESWVTLPALNYYRMKSVTFKRGEFGSNASMVKITTMDNKDIAGGEEQDVNAWAQPFSWTLTDNVPGEGAKFYCTAGGLGVEWITIEYELDFGTAE